MDRIQTSCGPMSDAVTRGKTVPPKFRTTCFSGVTVATTHLQAMMILSKGIRVFVPTWISCQNLGGGQI